ncbi:MAG: DNA methyltransferase [Dehalococcoidia bacterium]
MRYIDDLIAEGKAVDDVFDMPIISSSDKERLGYPTQKPERLLERLILAASNEGDIVLDPFAGCGTTMVAAQRLQRKWVGIDISPTAVGLIQRRLEKIGATNVHLVNMPTTEEQLRELKPFEFQNWVIQRFNGTHSPRKTGDMGIDGFSFLEHYPIQVKQSSGIGRNVVDNFETAIERNGKTKGYIVAFSFGKGAHEEAARVKGTKGLNIELLTVAEVLADNSRLVTPMGQMFAEIPLPPPRAADARPTVEELIKSGESANNPEA